MCKRDVCLETSVGRCLCASTYKQKQGVQALIAVRVRHGLNLKGQGTGVRPPSHDDTPFRPALCIAMPLLAVEGLRELLCIADSSMSGQVTRHSLAALIELPSQLSSIDARLAEKHPLAKEP